MVRTARAQGMRFAWVGVDAGYGKAPAFLRALDDMGEVFVADVHATQRVWTEPPGLHVPAPKKAVRQASSKPPWMASRWRNWSPASAPTTGSAASCATARAARCGSTSRI